MALSSTTLRDELVDALDDLTGTSAPDAVERICEAWGEYFKQASMSGIPPLAGGVDAGVALMQTAMTFTNGASAAAGADIFRSGVLFFWAHLQANTTLYWPGTTAGTPPAGIAGITAALTSVFGTNNDAAITRQQAATNMATALHAGNTGGTVMIGALPYTIT